MTDQATKSDRKPAYFQPLEVVRTIKDDYLRYLLTTFPVSGTLYDNLAERLLNDSSPWAGPFVTISQPYVQGGNVRDVLGELQMSPLLAGLMPPRLYGHQEQAVRNIVGGRNTIITTGTGSGKTESFLLPVLDYCIKHPEPGIKAILLYPMNSLAEDQADRLRRYLYLLNQKLDRRPVTFARYTGSTPNTWDERHIGKVRCPLCDAVNTEGQRRCLVCSGVHAGDATLQAALLPNGHKALICPNESPSPVTVEYECVCREDIRTLQPDILITNYKMLDLLLMRQEDHVLFSNSVRFVVADELHSYLGAQGTELACLLRRLAARISGTGSSSPVFVGASATI
ncbi:MAG: DEAD/DEAH box helicase, partial [Syntrophaceae bacterium]|nr:DEAD/DEAH box helicase [Syntrophaceae bacterium]